MYIIFYNIVMINATTLQYSCMTLSILIIFITRTHIINLNYMRKLKIQCHIKYIIV